MNQCTDEFKQAISLREVDDIVALEKKLGRSLSKQERNRIGVSSLKLFLEELLQKRYMDSVSQIIPLLEKEHRSTTEKLNKINQELSTLDEVKLKEKGRAFNDFLLTKLSLLLKGTVVAPPDKFGETLQDERINGGAFTGTDGLQFPQNLIPNAGMCLYGGAQYHRAMAEFRFVVGGIKCTPLMREKIVNACGVEDIHDETNYSMTSYVIAVAKARDTFEPFLHQLGGRLLHILKRLLPISVFLLQKSQTSQKFTDFPCMEDLTRTTRYVWWSLHNKNGAGLRQFLDSFSESEQLMVVGNSASLPESTTSGFVASENWENKLRADVKLNHLALGNDSTSGVPTTETRLADLLDSTLWNRRLGPSSERIVYALVQQIFHGIKEYFLASAELKFNCFLLMPVVDKLPALLREDLDSAFEDVDNVFDITTLRHSLGQRKQETEIELKRVQRLEEKFRRIHEYIYANSSC